MATYTLPGADLARILAGALELASTERTLPALVGVRLVVDNGKLVAASTDSFIAGVFLVCDAPEGAVDDVFLATPDVKRIAAAAKANKAVPVFLDLSPTGAVLHAERGDTGAMAEGSTPPDMVKLVRETFAKSVEAGELGEGHTISPIIYGQLAKVAAWGDAVRLRISAPGKAMLWTAGDAAYGLLMPVRLPIEHDAFGLPSWA